MRMTMVVQKSWQDVLVALRRNIGQVKPIEVTPQDVAIAKYVLQVLEEKRQLHREKHEKVGG